MSVCEAAVTFAAAVTACDNQGGRLCSSAEMQQGLPDGPCSTGCGYNNKAISMWTSDACTSPSSPPNQLPRPPPSPPPPSPSPPPPPSLPLSTALVIAGCGPTTSCLSVSQTAHVRCCGGSSPMSVCEAAVTFAAAVTACDNRGGRLCSSAEMQQGLPNGPCSTGCGYNNQAISMWTSDACTSPSPPPNQLPRPPPSPPAPSP